jgi:hypothetical protein
MRYTARDFETGRDLVCIRARYRIFFRSACHVPEFYLPCDGSSFAFVFLFFKLGRVIIWRAFTALHAGLASMLTVEEHL